MKREIKFRAKHEESNNWVFGSLFQNEVCSRIIPKESVIIDGVLDEYFTVYEKTVGQFTGLKDKNGVDIYEGDILNIGMDTPAVVGWSEGFSSFILGRKGWMFSHWFGESCNPNECEVVGNIYETPELLTVNN